MFRRHWSGLPRDVSFPSDLKDLGYFVNDVDEIRAIDNPDYYFKFFINRNLRINMRQRFEFNYAMERIINERLESEGLNKMAVPLGTPAAEPHTSIFISPELEFKSRVVVIFGEPCQQVGLIAGRVANGPGGITKGSMIPIVRAIQQQVSTATDSSAPGIVLANMGQLYWWPEGKRPITIVDSAAIPLPSSVHVGRKYVPSLNNIPGNEDPFKHVDFLFNNVFPSLIGQKAKLDVVAIGESCEIVERFLDKADAWENWGQRLNSLLFLGPVYPAENLSNDTFKDFLSKRARGYLQSSDPVDMPLAASSGNPNNDIPGLGYPCYSSSEPCYVELIPLQCQDAMLSWIQDVALDPNYTNPAITIVQRPEREVAELEWDAVPEDQRPQIATVSPEAMENELKNLRRWKRFEKTGQTTLTDSDSDSDS